MGIGKQERVEEEGAVTGREGGDDFFDMWLIDRRPCGMTNFTPEIWFSGEGTQVRGYAGSGGKVGTVEFCEDVSLDYILMKGRDCSAAAAASAVTSGSARRRGSHLVFIMVLIAGSCTLHEEALCWGRHFKRSRFKRPKQQNGQTLC